MYAIRSYYALEGFKVEALDYLLKPFDYAEFLTAANKAREWFSLEIEAHHTAAVHRSVPFPDFDIA